MTAHFGIDTSILVRLLTGEPAEDFDHCVSRLSALKESDDAEIFASNQVIGEAYIAVQHHYGVSRVDAKSGLAKVLRSGLVSPLNGYAVMVALEASDSPGLFGRLIMDGYSKSGLDVLTLDRGMASLPGAQRL